MTISVTQEDISMGVRRQCKSCPIALALRRINPDYRVDVDTDRIRFGNKSFNTPEKVRDFIKAFDAKKQVSPFTFRLS